MEQLLPVINKLQDVFTLAGTEPIDLPQIVVVGSQSSGKSSVLEHIVGRDFLPRGSGIVTRRPLILQLSTNKLDSKEWGEFLHKPNVKFTDFSEIREEIKRETDRAAGSNKGVINSPINLKICSPHVLNLTLVDLPGMTRVPVGDQPTNIEEIIRKMIKSYISRPNAIILALTAANTDLSNSDALQLASEVDPEGKRTLGVLTKLDIMDRGTSAVDVLYNRAIPLALGYVGVINRSQEDINRDKPISEALKTEALFFENHPNYSAIASRCGTPFLAQRLNEILLNHIKEVLPSLKTKIVQKIGETEAELATYGDVGLLDSKSSQGALLLRIITAFSEDFKNTIDGKSPAVMNKTEISGGARINYIFTDMYTPVLKEIDPLTGLTVDEIRTALRNATGPHIGIFVPESCFEQLVRAQISRLEDPSIRCLDLVYEELLKLVSSVESRILELQRFQILRENLIEAVTDLLRGMRAPARQMILNMIALHLAYINTSHTDFIGSKTFSLQQPQQATAPAANGPPTSQPTSKAGSMPRTLSPPTKVVPSDSEEGLRMVPTTIKITTAATEKENNDTELIKTLLESYFNTVRKNINDTVPKAIMHFLVNTAKENMHNELVNRLYHAEKFSELLEEQHGIVEKRKACKAILDALQKAQKIVNQVRGM
ncbi:dynamin GTPase [Pelomyxa schiedti]|nr:dynamin GTPase [Pelomyxa schiedti]